MTNVIASTQRVSHLQSLGYNATEASFLCLAALHSGFFLRRQYAAFTGKVPGYADVTLGEKAVRNGHVRVTALRHNRMLYHLYSKPFYSALGEEDNRNRRRREPQAIKHRLMALDFVLANRACQFFPTEAEKLAFFGGALGIDYQYLPQKVYRGAQGAVATTRYFVDKSPVYSNPDQDPNQPLVHFCYVDEGQHSTNGFEQYLNDYRALLARVARFEILYLACSADNFSAAEHAFEKFRTSMIGVPLDPLVTRTIEYFNVSDAVNRRDMAGINQAKLIQLRSDRVEFSGVKYARLFEIWKRHGDDAVAAELSPESVAKPSQVMQFRTHVLPFKYELFGTPTRSNSKGEIECAHRK